MMPDPPTFLWCRAVREDGWVELRAVGSCHGCSASVLTLQGALAPKLRERCPWFRGVRGA
jgi:Fe-S cluster biogenesis protein NfuA